MEVPEEDSQGGADEREIELSTLASIYPELEIHNEGSEQSSKSQKVVKIRIPVEPVLPLKLSLPRPNITNNSAIAQTAEDESNILESHGVSHLPPLQVALSLPVDYPRLRPPSVSITVDPAWLDRRILERLEQGARKLWEDLGHEQMLFAYLDQLREAAEQGFSLGGSLQVPFEQLAPLLDFDLKEKKLKFEKETFECLICLEPKKGSQCYRLQTCGHVFCVPCLQDFYTTSIMEGDIGNIKCMKPNCKRLSNTIAKPLEPSRPDPTLEPSELLQIPLEQDAVQRFIKLKRKKQLESNPNTVYCPRSWCQGPARTKPSAAAAISTLQTPATESNENKRASSSAPPLPAPSDRLAICEDCSFAFCLVCKISWHGEYYVCFPRSQFELTAEERASEDFLKLHTQACPTCNARAQKTMGCNHMICFKCDTHFCYLCGSYLQRENPYQHFNDKKNGCFMRLWELEEGDEGGAAGDHAFAGGPVHIADPPAHPDAPLAPIDRWIPEEASDDDTDEDAAYFAERWAEPIGINLADLNININIPPPAPMPPPNNQRNINHPNQIQGNARAGRGRGNAPQDRNHQPAQPPAQPADLAADDDERREGLRRFLRMVQDDREDEWDSDEMSDPGAELHELAQ